MKYYIIAGEASGDLHGSRLISAILKNDAAADIRAWGGDLMQAEGAKLVKHYRDLAFMGFAEVLFHIKTIFDNYKESLTESIAMLNDISKDMQENKLDSKITDFENNINQVVETIQELKKNEYKPRAPTGHQFSPTKKKR